jgi:hypothetical protein
MAQRGKTTPASEHTVGYRNPPVHSRFKKGESGNPNGRPKGTVNFATVLLRTLRETVVIKEDGKRTVVTKLEASVKQLVNKAASGDLRALSHLIGITLTAEQSAAEEKGSKEVLNELDKKVMSNILKRYAQSMKGDTDYGKNTD